MNDTQTGTVKFYNEDKGYGFIAPDGGGKDVFVHVSAINEAGLGDIKEGEKLEYCLGDNRGRTCAGSLRRSA